MDKYRCKDKEVKKSMRQDKRKWVEHLVMEAEEAARNGRMKEVYDITTTLGNDKRKTTNAVTYYANGKIGQKGAMERTL